MHSRVKWPIWANNIRGSRSLILQKVGNERHLPVRRLLVGNPGLILIEIHANQLTYHQGSRGSIERAAAIAMLDELHNEPDAFERNSSDPNAYDWGEIGQHNVVIASLHARIYGTTSAATTASQLLSSLPHFSIGLIVGIGGGIPQPDQDIQLGDIVVGQPDGATGGVV